MRRKGLGIIMGLVVVVILLVWIGNHVMVQSTINAGLRKDARNEGIEFSGHYRAYIFPSELVLDLRAVGPTNTPNDVFRVLLQSAYALREDSFKRVYLSCSGKCKFLLDGKYFQTLGLEYESQNPIYTMRTFPEHLYSPTGERAFDSWTGGMLGVLQAQMKDYLEFHRQWYVYAWRGKQAFKDADQ